MPEITLPAASERRDLAATIHHLARIVQTELSSGDLAELRRADPGSHPPSAFWKLAAKVIQPDGHLRASPLNRELEERRWLAVLRTIATLRELALPGVPAGRALAEANFSEARLNRLLRVTEPAVFEEVRRAAHFLASKGTAADPTDFARLLLSNEEQGEQARRRLARSFYDFHFAS